VSVRPKGWGAWPVTEIDTLRPPVSSELLHEFLLAIPGRERMTVADLDCGTGKRLSFLASHFSRVVALSATTEREGRARLSCPDAEVSFRCAGLNDLAAFGASFDVALAVEPIRATIPAEVDRIFEQARGTLVEGGLFVCCLPAAPRIGGPLRLRLSSDTEPDESRRFHEVELQYRLRRAGYQGVRIRRLRAPESADAVLFCTAVRRASN